MHHVRRREPSPEFGVLLRGLMERRGISTAELARVCRVRPTFIYCVLRGESPLPEGRLESVASAFGLTGIERDRFRLEALATYAPREVREALWRFQAEAGKSRRR